MTELYAQERRDAIADEARARGRVAVAELAETYRVTPETVRRDLTALEAAGLVRRVHGGAVLAANVSLAEETVATRAREHAGAKAAIAAAALALLDPHGPTTLFLDAGTTTLQVAMLLPPDRAITVVTSSLAVATVAAERVEHVHLVGGRLRPVTGATVGANAVERVRTLRTDLLFLGTNGVSAGHGCSTPDPEEAAMKTAMVQAANRVVLLADSSKFGVERLVGFARLDELDVVITDARLPRTHRDVLAEHGIEVVVA